MPGFNQAACADAFSKAATIQDVWNPGGGWFSVSDNGAFVALQYPISKGSGFGQSEWTDEQQLGAGAFGFIPAGATGIRFRNAVAGQVATVTATIAQGNEPALAISALGSVVIAVTNLVTQQILSTLGAGTYTLPSGCRAILVECIAGGGGGGGTQSTAGLFGAAAGGGAGGGYSASLITAPAASYAVSVGGGGGGGNNSSGTAGSDTTFGAVVVAKGGGGGAIGLSEAANTAIFAIGGQGSVAGAAGAVQLAGGPGGEGTNIGTGGASAVPLMGGCGGNAARGGGGGRAVTTSTTNVAAGNAGFQFGGGGSGAAAGSGFGPQTGGNGAQGVIIVTEFY